MKWDEYNKLFHKTQANLVAFQPLMQCDHEVIKMIEAAVEAEREACALAVEQAGIDGYDTLAAAAAIRARGQGCQGLTNEEVENFVQAVWPRGATPTDYIRAIEAKLKEKNG